MSKYYDASSTRFDESSSFLYPPLPSYLKPSSRFSQVTDNLKREQLSRSQDSSKTSFHSDSRSQFRKEKMPFLNMGVRKKKVLRQSEENLRLMQKILDSKPSISRRKLERDWHKSQGYVVLASQFPHYKLTSESKQDLAKLEAGFTINSDRKPFGNSKDLSKLSYRDQYIANSKKHRYSLKRDSDPNVSLMTNEDYMPRSPFKLQRMPTQVTSLAREVGSPVNLQEIIDYLEQNESEGEFEVYYYGNIGYDDNNVPLRKKSSKKVSIIKSKSLSAKRNPAESTPLSKVSFEDEFSVHNKPNNRLRPLPIPTANRRSQILLPGTNELLVQTSPPPGVPLHQPMDEDDGDYEIIYMNKSRNGYHAANRAKSRVDRDRIHMMYDDKHNDDNIHVVYSENNYTDNDNNVDSQGSFGFEQNNEELADTDNHYPGQYLNPDPRSRFNDSYNAAVNLGAKPKTFIGSGRNGRKPLPSNRGDRFNVSAPRKPSASFSRQSNKPLSRSSSFGGIVNSLNPTSAINSHNTNNNNKSSILNHSTPKNSRTNSATSKLNRSSSFAGKSNQVTKIGGPASADNRKINDFDSKPIKKAEAFIVY